MYLADIAFARAEEVVKRICQRGGHALALHVDVSSADEVEKALLEATAQSGRLDYVFNNAAIAAVGEFRDGSIEDFRRVVDVNLFGVVHGSAAAYRIMLRQGFGHIINVSSVTGFMPAPILTAYSATKWAIIGFSLALREEAAGLGVKVSVACPGLVNTDIAERNFYWNVRKEDYLAWLPWRKHMLTPETAAASILRGVARNQAVIVFPFSARIGLLLYHLCPFILAPVWRRMLARFREIRTNRGPF